jgi:hypothetical protein
MHTVPYNDKQPNPGCVCNYYNNNKKLFIIIFPFVAITAFSWPIYYQVLVGSNLPIGWDSKF